jgi:glycosyltransferase involved in cell wall biosynthesis
MLTLSDIDDPRLRRVRQNNGGKPVAMNRALELVRGDFYALLDADDLSHPHRLKRQVACLVDHPAIAGVFCGHELILEDRAIAPTFRAKSMEQCAQEIARGWMPAHDPTAMYRVSLVKDFRYTEDLPIVEGHDYILRVGERFPLMVVGECLYGYRIHPQSVTKKDPARRIRLTQEVLNRMCDRRGVPRPTFEPNRVASDRPWDADNDIVSHFTASVADLVNAGRHLDALRVGIASWRLHPMSAYYGKPFVYALLPRPAMRIYHTVKRWRESRNSAHQVTGVAVR